MFLRNSIAKNSFPFQFYPLKVAEGKPFSKNTGIKILGRVPRKEISFWLYGRLNFDDDVCRLQPSTMN